MIMTKKTVKIDGDNEEILNVALNDVLSLIEKKNEAQWSILNLEGTWDASKNGSVLEFEKEVRSYENGLILTTSELMNLSEKFIQIIETFIIGDKDLSNLKRYSTDKEAYANCDYVIELYNTPRFLDRQLR